MINIHQCGEEISNIDSLITKSLPVQGCVEVQRDVPGKEHIWHKHDTDETIVVLEGGLRFYWEQGERMCQPGDVVSLPAGTPHGSVALDDGAVYLIAFHSVNI